MSEFMCEVVDKNEFYKKLDSYYRLKPAKKPYTKEKMETVIQEILTAKSKLSKTKNRREYHLLKTYEVLTVGGTSYLTKKSTKEEPTGEFMVCYEELYDRIYDNHVNKTRHGGRVKMEKEFKTKLQVPRPALEIFLSCCEKCSNNKQCVNRAIVPTLLSKGFCQRVQVDLIDLQLLPNGNFKWILIYQDQSTKFVILRSLNSNDPKEVATQLLNIMLLIGAPKILQSNLGRDYAAKLIQEIHNMWTLPIIVNGPSNPKDQIENSNQEIINMLKTWMEENKNKQWSVGLDFIQWKNNSSYQKSLERTPYKALFGMDPQLGLTTSKVNLSVAQNMKTEEDLENLVACMQTSTIGLTLNNEENINEESILNSTMEDEYENNSVNPDDIKSESNIDTDEIIICCICYLSMEKHEQQCKKCSNAFHEACMTSSSSVDEGSLCGFCNKRAMEERSENHPKKLKVEPE